MQCHSDISLSATNSNLVRTNLIYSFKDTLMNIFQLETLMKQISAGINWIYFYDFPAANLTLINIAISSDSIWNIGEKEYIYQGV